MTITIQHTYTLHPSHVIFHAGGQAQGVDDDPTYGQTGFEQDVGYHCTGNAGKLGRSERRRVVDTASRAEGR